MHGCGDSSTARLPIDSCVASAVQQWSSLGIPEVKHLWEAGAWTRELQLCPGNAVAFSDLRAWWVAGGMSLD